MLLRVNPGRTLALGLLLSLPLAGCSDELPTVSGEELFPSGTRPFTAEVVIPAESFARTVGTFTGYAGPRDSDFLLVANRFEGALEANTLARLAAFPTTLSYSFGGTSRTDSVFTVRTASVFAAVDTAASAGSGPVTLRLWEAGQAWDRGSTTWELAVDTAGERTPWRTPGGTRGAPLSEVTVASARAVGDTLRFPLDTAAVRRIRGADFRGLLVTAAGAPLRLQLSGGLRLRAEVRPAGADTLVRVDVGPGEQTYVFTPEPPRSGTAWEAGGVRSARTLFRVDLGLRVPVCSAGGTCAQLPLSEVTLNEVTLLLRPVAVPQGFRPLGTAPIVLRRVAEPELGRRAPLGAIVNEVVAIDPATRSTLFGGTSFTAGDSVVQVPITTFARGLLAGDSTSATLALLGESPGGARSGPAFGVAWFDPNPRLRIVYTVPVRPTLP